jgi:hypothetical protein
VPALSTMLLNRVFGPGLTAGPDPARLARASTLGGPRVGQVRA